MPNALAAKGYEVHAVSRSSGSNAGSVCWHAADLLDSNATKDLVATVAPTHLMHLAWITEPGVYWQSPQNNEWLDASLDLLEQFKQQGGQRAVLAGTCAEYDWTDGHCVEDQTPLRAKSLYAETKLAFREAALELSADTDLSVAWARVFFSFGPGERAERLVPTVIRALLADDRAKCGDGSLLRDFMYVTDVANAMVAVLDSDFEGDINIASGAALSLEELVSRIATKLAAADRVDFGHYPRRPDDPQKISADISRLRDVIGWSPEYDLDSAIDNTIAWWKKRSTT
jgi:nucleoside-diphosphate-sugar epimerase